MPKGFIYIFRNPAMKGLLKIGFSTKIPTERARKLHSTGVPDAFKVSYYCLVEDAKSIEKKIHKNLESVRYSKNREFFKVELEEAVNSILSICQPEYEWSDEILLKSPNGKPTNLEELGGIVHGIQIISRRNIDSQIEEMIHFCELAHEQGLDTYVKSMVYCSNSDCCSFEFTDEVKEHTELANKLHFIASKPIDQFDWFGSVDHGEVFKNTSNN